MPLHFWILETRVDFPLEGCCEHEIVENSKEKVYKTKQKGNSIAQAWSFHTILKNKETDFVWN